MDKVKAIKVLKPLVESYVDYANITMKEDDDDIVDALEMAIEALKALDVPDTNVGDTISRRAAIDAVMRDVSCIRTHEFNAGATRAANRIKQLPSVQPERSSEIQDILEYLDKVLHPVISPGHWNVYSELHDMISMLPSVQPEHKTVTRKEAIEKIKEITIKDDFREFVNSLNLCRDDYKTIMEYIDELPAVQPDHVADIGKKVSISCGQENDLISRQAAIDALARMMPRSYTPDGSHPADEEIFRAQEVFADCIEALEILPSAQPATNCSEIPNGSDDTISRQVAIDVIMGQPPEPHYPAWYAAQIEKLPAVQPDHIADVSKKVADEDCISRRMAIDSLHGYFDGMLETDTWSPCDVYGLIEILPSVPPERVCVATVTLTDGQVEEAVEKVKNAVISVIEPEIHWIPCSERLPEEDGILPY